MLEQYQATLPVRITPEEELSMGRLQAELRGEFEQLDVETRRYLADVRARRKDLEQRMSKAARVIREGADTRPVVVLVVADYARNVAEHMRHDTHELLPEKTRPLRPEEKQVRLFDDCPPRRHVCLGTEPVREEADAR